jgi:hypothetical protein
MNATILFFTLLGGYFLPSLIANSREHQSTNEILRLNLFAGWTGIGWLGALVWSLSAKRSEGETWHE